MDTDMIEDAQGTEAASAEENEKGAEKGTETEKAPEVSDLDRLAFDGKSESTSEESENEESIVESETKSGSTEDTSAKEKPAAPEGDKKSQADDKAARDSAGVAGTGSAFGATDPALLVEAGQAGISPELASRLAQAGPDTLRNAIAEWPKQTAASESAKGQEKKPEIPEIKIDREEYGDDIANAFETLTAQLTTLTEQNNAMAVELTGVKAGSTRDASRETEAEFDQQIGALGEDWSELFGSGSSASMKGTSEHRNREEVFNQMVLDDAVREQTGQPPLTREQSFMRALHGIHYEHASKLTTQGISRSVTKRSGQSIQKPAPGGKKSPEKGRELAIETARKKQEELGIG